MPELVEVEYSRKLLLKYILNKRIVNVSSLEQGGGPRDGLFDDLILKSFGSSVDVGNVFLASSVEQVGRKGKQLWLELRNKNDSIGFALFHQGMTGNFRLRGVESMQYKSFKVDNDVWPPKFTKLALEFDDGTKLAFVDPRRLGRVRYVSSIHEDEGVQKLAPDALNELPPIKEFVEKLKTFKLPLKTLLLDQHKLVSGIGNWIADEVCYQSRLHPEIKTNTLEKEEADRVHEAVKYILKTGCENEEFPSDWLFHRRWTKRKQTFKEIDFITVNGRTTAYAPAIQKKKNRK